MPEPVRQILITGGTDGMGKETALLLAGQGTRLIIVGRSRERGEATEAALRATGADATFLRADLSTIRRMREVAAEVRRRLDHLDLLVHTAGGLFSNRPVLTEDGLERTFVLQVLVRFVLTEELVDLLTASASPKVVVIAGGGTYDKSLDLTDLQGEKTHSFFGSMAKQAVANDVLTAALIAHHPAVTFYNYGPGLVRTKVSMPNVVMRLFMGTVGRLFSRSAADAAADLAALVSGDHPSGFYGVGLRRNDPGLIRREPALPEQLWTYCAERASLPRPASTTTS